MAEWLSLKWIEKAIYSFHDKNAALPKLARAQIIQYNRAPSKENPSAEALLSDKWMYAKAIFTPDSIQEFVKSKSNASEEFSVIDIKGGLIFLHDYKVSPHVDYQKGVWEHLLVVNKFSYVGSQKSTQFGSELINSAAHSPFQVKIKKHFQLQQIAKLLQCSDDGSKTLLKEDKCVDVAAVMNGILARHQYAFVPEDQEKLLDDIPGWRNDVPPSQGVSNSARLSLPSISNEHNHSKSSNSHSNEITSDCSVQELVAQCLEVGSFSDSYFPGTQHSTQGSPCVQYLQINTTTDTRNFGSSAQSYKPESMLGALEHFEQLYSAKLRPSMRTVGGIVEEEIVGMRDKATDVSATLRNANSVFTAQEKSDVVPVSRDVVRTELLDDAPVLGADLWAEIKDNLVARKSSKDLSVEEQNSQIGSKKNKLPTKEPESQVVRAKITPKENYRDFFKENVVCNSFSSGEQTGGGTSCSACMYASKGRCPHHAASSSLSEGSSSTGRKSDESFSILHDVSISDLVPGGFVPEYTSTAKTTVTSLPVHNDVIAKKTNAKHVTFGKSFVFEKNVPLRGINAITSESALVLHDDSYVCCTQEDHEPRSVRDPLRLRGSVLPSTDNPRLREHLPGQIRKSTGSETSPTQDDDSVDGRDDDDIASCVFSADEDIVMCSDDSPEITSSPVAVAIDSIIQCIRQTENLNNGDIVFVLDSNESPEYRSSTPSTVAKASVLGCIEKQSKSDSDFIATGAKSTSVETDVLEVLEVGSGPKQTRLSLTTADTTTDGNSISKQNNISKTTISKSKPTSLQKPIYLYLQNSTDSKSDGNSFSAKNCPLKVTEISHRDSLKLKQTERRSADFANTAGENTTFEFSISDSQLVQQVSQASFSSRPRVRGTSLLQESKSVVDSPEPNFPGSDARRTHPFNRELSNREHTDLEIVEISSDEEPLPLDSEVGCLVCVAGQKLQNSSLSVSMNSNESTDSQVKSNTKKNNLKRVGTSEVKLSKEKQNEKENSPMESSNSISKDTCEKPSYSRADKYYTNKGIGRDGFQSAGLSTRLVNTTIHAPEISNVNSSHSGSAGLSAEKSVLSKRLERNPGNGLLGGMKRKRSQDSEGVDMKKPTIDIASLEMSCDHVMYSQQDPLVLDDSFSSDETSSQDTNADVLSSPVLIPSPPLSAENELYSRTVNTSPKNYRDPEISSESVQDDQESSRVCSLGSKKSEESSTSDHCCLSISLSLPSYQVPRETKCLPSQNKLEHKNTATKTEAKTLRKKVPVISISDSDDDDNGFCWFTTKSWNQR